MYLYTKTMTTRLLAVAALSCLASAETDVVWQNRSDKTIEEAVKINASDFTEPNVLRLCRSFLAAHADAVMIRFLIVTDAQEALNHLRGPGVTDIDFPSWRQYYLAQSRQPPATAELIRIRARAMVRLRFGDGRLEERILQSGDPLKISFSDEIVYIRGLAATYTNAPQGVSPMTMALFAQTCRPWNLTKAEAFSRMIRQQTGLRWIVVVIEDGWWFAGGSKYPIYNRFMPYIQPPTFDDFKRHYRFFCADGNGRCTQTGPARK